MNTTDNRSIEITEEIEPLAADIRGSDMKERSKKLNTEMLRLLAPMLNCTYDDLKQRRREYIFKRTLTVVTAAALGVIFFLIFLLYKNEQIHQADRDKLLEQNRYISSKAEIAYADNQILSAIELALQSYPAEGSDITILPTSQYVLSRALNCYITPDKEDIRAQAAYEYDGNGYDILVDADQQRLITKDSNLIYIWDLETNQLLFIFEPEIKSNIPQNMFSNNLLDTDSSAVIFSDGFEIISYNYIDNSINWRFNNDSNRVWGLYLLKEESQVDIIDDSAVSLYDLSTGEKTAVIPIQFDGYSVSADTLALSPDHTMLAVDLHDDSTSVEYTGDGSIDYELEFQNEQYANEKDRIALINLEEQSIALTSTESSLIDKLEFLSDTQILICSIPDLRSAYIYNSDRVQSTEMKQNCRVSVMECSTDTVVWENEFNPGAFTADCHVIAGDNIVIAAGNKCFLLDKTSGNILNTWETDSKICYISLRDNGDIIAICENGKTAFFTPGDNTFSTVTYFDRNIMHVVQDAQSYFIRYESDYSTKEITPVLVRYQFVSDENFHEISDDESEALSKKKKRLLKTDENIKIGNATLKVEDDRLIKYETNNSTEPVWTLTLDSSYYKSYSDEVTWQVVDDERIYLISSTRALEIDISDKTYGVIASIDNFSFYDPDKNQIYVEEDGVNGDGIIGYFSHYSGEELKEMGQALLNN